MMTRRKERGFIRKIGFSKNIFPIQKDGKYIPTTAYIFEICNVLGETPDYYLIGTPTKETDKITALIKTLPDSNQAMLLKLLELNVSEISSEQQK